MDRFDITLIASLTSLTTSIAVVAFLQLLLT